MQHYRRRVVATRSGWARENSRALQGFLRALSDAIDWLYNSTNRADAFAIFRDHMPASDDKAAGILIIRLITIRSPALREMALSISTGLQKYWNFLRSKFGQPPKPLGGPGRYFDPSYLQTALGGSR